MAKRNGIRIENGRPRIDITVNGRRVTRTVRSGSIEEARKLRAKIEGDLWRQSALGESPKVAWGEAVIALVQQREQSGMRSLSDLKDKLRWFTQHLSSITDLNAITKPMIIGLLEKKRAEGASGATMNRYYAAMSALLHFAHARGWVSVVPKLAKSELQPERMRVVDVDDATIERLLAELPEHLYPIVRFTLATGVRQANAAKLQWWTPEFNINASRYPVAQLDPADGSPSRIIVPGSAFKNGQPWTVPLSPEACAILRLQQGKHREWVFPWRGSYVCQPSNTAWYAALDRAGLRGRLRWHDLRHVWATRHLRNETPAHVLKELGGWHTYSMVERYAKWDLHSLSRYVGNSSIGTDSAQSPFSAVSTGT
jgi:integrase